MTEITVQDITEKDIIEKLAAMTDSEFEAEIAKVTETILAEQTRLAAEEIVRKAAEEARQEALRPNKEKLLLWAEKIDAFVYGADFAFDDKHIQYIYAVSLEKLLEIKNFIYEEAEDV